MNLKLHFDEKTSFEVWRASDLTKRTYILMILIACLGTHLCIGLSSGFPEVTPYWLAVAGALGGALSGIAKPFGAAPVSSATNVLLRPILGSIAGLILYLLIKSNMIELKPLLSVFVAMAMGFSETAISGMLREANRSLCDSVTRSVGQQLRRRP